MPSPLAPTTRFRPKPNVLVRELGGEAVLLDIETGRYFGLNATGVRIWALLGEGEELATDPRAAGGGVRVGARRDPLRPCSSSAWSSSAKG